MDSLVGSEELLVLPHHLVGPGTTETEVLAHERSPVSGEDPIGKLKIKQPVASPRRHKSASIHEKLTRWLVMKNAVLNGILVILHADNGYAAEIKRLNLGGVLTASIVPEDQTL